MQVNCSELVILVPDAETARKLFLRALELPLLHGNTVALVHGYDVVRDELLEADAPPADVPSTIELTRIPFPEDVEFVDRGDWTGLVLRNKELIPYKYQDIVDEGKLNEEPIVIAYSDGYTPSYTLIHYKDGGETLFYSQHTQPQLYSILAQLSYEFKLPIASYDGGNLVWFRSWLIERNIDYETDEKDENIIVLEPVLA